LAQQATLWRAQYTDKSTVQGGQYPTDPNVSVVDTSRLISFQIVHNTYRDMYYVPRTQWYHDTTPIDVVYPLEYVLQDGSLLTINRDDETGHLVLTQTFDSTTITAT
jgi:hypothetical protein